MVLEYHGIAIHTWGEDFFDDTAAVDVAWLADGVVLPLAFSPPGARPEKSETTGISSLSLCNPPEDPSKRFLGDKLEAGGFFRTASAHS